ncbi:MAG: hypothetical protein M3P85_13460 [Actinomycetota bacterium]|nr:hypothetical protein [Actinomycetota bacterium]
MPAFDRRRGRVRAAVCLLVGAALLAECTKDRDYPLSKQPLAGEARDLGGSA